MKSKKFKCIEPNCQNKVKNLGKRCPHCAAIERNKDPEYLKKQSLANRGQKRSDEAKKKMSKTLCEYCHQNNYTTRLKFQKIK